MATATTPVTPAADAGTAIERADALAQINAWIREAQENGEVDEGVMPDYLAELLESAEQDLRAKMERVAAVYRRKGTEVAVIDAQLAEAKRDRRVLPRPPLDRQPHRAP